MVQCYDWNSNTSRAEVLSDVWVLCPAGNNCCIGIDVCLDYNLCSSRSTYKRDGSFSGYYVARCADPTFTDPTCPKVCGAPGPPDAVYNTSSQQWNCCGTDTAGHVSCDNPSPEVFQAPAPSALVVVQSGAVLASSATLISGLKTTSSSSSTSVLSSPSASGTSASSHGNQAPTSNELSSGAKAGIGICVVLGAVAIAALVAFLLFRRKNQSNRDEGRPAYTDYPEYNPAGTPFIDKLNKARYAENELPANNETTRQMLLGHPVLEIDSSR